MHTFQSGHVVADWRSRVRVADEMSESAVIGTHTQGCIPAQNKSSELVLLLLQILESSKAVQHRDDTVPSSISRACCYQRQPGVGCGVC